MDTDPLSSSEMTRLSRMLALILRHKPETAGIELDERGAIDLNELADALAEMSGWEFIGREHILDMVETVGQRRFAIDFEANTIRARYGHSMKRVIKYDPAEPPEKLYHGSEYDVAEDILIDGLQPMGRQYVHLSVSERVAFDIGRRRTDDPAILVIDAKAAHEDGLLFYPATEEIWLTEDVPTKYIKRLDGDEE